MAGSTVVVGGGPAGVVCGLLLARQGVEVTVLEEHGDFLRDFRGDTVHPSTLQVLHELGWLEDFLALPHSRLDRVAVRLDGVDVVVADSIRLPVVAPCIAFVPQWDFLDLLVRRASAHPTFRLVRGTAATGVVWDHGRAVGVRVDGSGQTRDHLADVVIGADGRHSTVRREAGLRGTASASPSDVFWFRLPREAGQQVPFFQGGQGSLVCACTLPTGAAGQLRDAGLPAFRERVASIQPALRDALETVTSWDDVRLLTVRIDRLRRWHRPGLLCIGDAAHAMSPAGGVGVDLAVQDAVATANILGPVLTGRAGHGAVDRALAAVQRRRSLPTRITQLYQARVLRGLYPRTVADDTTAHPPLVFRLFRRAPAMRHLGGRFIGLGARPEHVGPAAHRRSDLGRCAVRGRDAARASGPRRRPVPRR